MASLELAFTDRANPRLVRVEFGHDDLWTVRRGTKGRRVERLCPEKPRLTAGSAAIALLAIQARLAAVGGGGRPVRLELVGGNGTPASSLHASLEKLPQDWHEDWFGADGKGQHLIGLCFPKAEPDGRTLVWLNEALLPVEKVRIHWDDGDVSDNAERLRELASRIFERHWDGSSNAVEASPRPEAASRSRPRRALRIAILRGGDLGYVADIADGFKFRLGEHPGWDVEYLDRSGPNVLLPWPEYAADLGRLARTILDADPFDCHVAIGTQACRTLHEALGPLRFGQPTPFLFLGATSPLRMGLVEGLQHRDDERLVAGVGYNDGEVDGIVQRMVRRLLTEEFFERNPGLRREPKLTFTYSANFEQDRHQAASLRSTEAHRAGLIEVRERSDLPGPEDLEEDRLHFGWFTFEVMFQEDSSTRDLLRSRKVVATTRANVRNGWAAIGVSVDDREIGRMGADLLVRHLDDGEPLGRMPVQSPPVRHWIHRGAAARLGLVLPDSLLDSASEVFG